MRSMDSFIERLREALKGPLPGRAAQLRMAPEWRHHTLESGTDFRRAAVLILLYPEDGVFRFPLIVRSAGPGPHGGQVAFPGGAVEKDETEVEAALREAREELGIDTEGIEVLGALTPLAVNISRFHVTPVVAYAAERPLFKPSPAEVADWFHVSLNELIDDAAKGTIILNRTGNERQAPCYRCSNRIVWGATAIALAEFEDLIGNLQNKEIG